MLNELYSKLKFREKIIMILFEDYTYKVYCEGVKVGFNYLQTQGCNKAVTPKQR